MSADEESIDALIRRFFAAFDNRNDNVPDEAALIGLFTEKAVVARHADGRCELSSPEEFARPRVALLRGGGLSNFHEREESSTMQIVGDIAMRSSRYSKCGLLRGADYRGRGTKFFQLAKMGGEWRIVSLVWTDDT